METTTAQTIIEFIRTLGFPMACVVILFLFWNKEITTHKEETQKSIEALNNNTLAIQKLSDMMDQFKNRGES